MLKKIGFTLIGLLVVYFGLILVLRPYYLTHHFVESDRYQFQVRSWSDLPMNDSSLVLIGNSLVKGFDSNSIGENVHKLAIGGDVLVGLKYRLDVLCNAKPKSLIINMGVNDIIHGFGFDINQLDQFISKVNLCSPQTKVYVMSLGPENLESGFFTNPTSIQKGILEANMQIEKFCLSNSIGFIDVYIQLSEDEKLKPEFSKDGIHLTEIGYAVWTSEILKSLNSTP